jgi:hypothetical protein
VTRIVNRVPTLRKPQLSPPAPKGRDPIEQLVSQLSAMMATLERKKVW